jgi:hypothetical protein
MTSRPGQFVIGLRLVFLILAATGIGLIGGYGVARTNPPLKAGSAPPAGKGSGSPTASAQSAAHQAAAHQAATPQSPATVTLSGSGRFVAAAGTSPIIGTSGPLIRFRAVVEVEAGVPAAQFAAFVEQVLGDRRGWASQGLWRFQRVDGETSVDQVSFTAHLSTPATTDQICGQHGLTTQGEVSCRGGSDVVINLKRWILAVPWYSDSVADYRAMVTNHEIGHFLGFDHQSCPGAGQLASVMQTQTSGLEGCARNPWPYPQAR